MIFIHRGLLCDGEGFSWSLLEAIKTISVLTAGSSLTLQEKLLSTSVSKRVTLLGKIKDHQRRSTEVNHFAVILPTVTLVCPPYGPRIMHMDKAAADYR